MSVDWQFMMVLIADKLWLCSEVFKLVKFQNQFSAKSGFVNFLMAFSIASHKQSIITLNEAILQFIELLISSSGALIEFYYSESPQRDMFNGKVVSDE